MPAATARNLLRFRPYTRHGGNPLAQSTVAIDGQRLVDDLTALARFGQHGAGVDRTAFSTADVDARLWLAGRFSAAGLSAGIDRFGNVLGAPPGDGPTILLGSHTDSVPKGGWLDGALGVLCGLEIVRALAERDGRLPPLEVISFQDEEGTFVPCLGSQSFCGDIGPGDIADAISTTGEPMADAIRRLPPSARGTFGLGDRPRLAFLEAHIEQGPRLHREGREIGVVSGIVGVRRALVTFSGQADHAGTTPMDMRKDAGAALIAFAHQVSDRFRRIAGENTVWNLGHIRLDPGAPNVVPALAELMVEYRDLSAEILDALQDALSALADETERAGPVAVTIADAGSVAPLALDPELTGCLADSAKTLGIAPLRMPSGAGHDAMVVGRHIPAGMLFVPSIGGRSHDVAEDTDVEDIVLGCRVLATAVDTLIGRHFPGA